MILKVFVYLSDVSEENGPFVYAPGTHLLGQVRRNPEFSLDGGVARTTDTQMDAIVSRKDWVSCCGPAGTIVLADTHGYHRGGLVRAGERLLYTCMFTSPSCPRRYFKVSEKSGPCSQQQRRIFGASFGMGSKNESSSLRG